MQNQRLLLFTLIAGLLVGCTSVKKESTLPDQAFGSPVAVGTRRVVFYNDTSVAAFPTSNRIGIKLDGKGVESPYSGQYVQLDVPSGEHSLELSHYDVVLHFHDKYPLKIEDSDVYLRIYCTPFATKYDLSREEPSDLRTKFKPIPNESK